MLPVVTAAINLVFVVLLGIIGYFLKQYIQQLVEHIQLCNTKHIDIAQLQTEIKGMTTLFTMQLASLNASIDLIRQDMRPNHEFRKGRS